MHFNSSNEKKKPTLKKYENLFGFLFFMLFFSISNIGTQTFFLKFQLLVTLLLPFFYFLVYFLDKRKFLELIFFFEGVTNKKK
jgi:hypothetical protein